MYGMGLEEQPIERRSAVFGFRLLDEVRQARSLRPAGLQDYAPGPDRDVSLLEETDRPLLSRERRATNNTNKLELTLAPCRATRGAS